MDYEERARAVIESGELCQYATCKFDENCMCAVAIAAAIREAVEEERAYCSQIVTDWLKRGELELRAGEMTAQERRTAKAVVGSIAAAIRARGGTDAS